MLCVSRPWPVVTGPCWNGVRPGALPGRAWPSTFCPPVSVPTTAWTTAPCSTARWWMPRASWPCGPWPPVCRAA
nr:MAG TPA: hypothetical protein [Caudoviricetes sp.]